MSMFKPPEKKVMSTTPHQTVDNGVSLRGDRTGDQYPTLPANYVRVDPSEPHHRRIKGKSGTRVKYQAVVDRVPREVLFTVESKMYNGWFDLDGYWCKKDSKGKVTVMRGPPKKVISLLKPEQRKELERVRLQARRNGMR